MTFWEFECLSRGVSALSIFCYISVSSLRTSCFFLSTISGLGSLFICVRPYFDISSLCYLVCLSGELSSFIIIISLNVYLCSNQTESGQFIWVLQSTSILGVDLSNRDHFLLRVAIIVPMPLQPLIGKFSSYIDYLGSRLFELLDGLMFLKLTDHGLDYLAAFLVQVLRL